MHWFLIGADDDVAADGPSRMILARRPVPSTTVVPAPDTGGDAKQAVTHCVRNAGCLFGVFVVTLLVCSHYFAHEAADALRIRRSARPHFNEGGTFPQNSGAYAPRDRAGVAV